jgi:hypothetical protein
VAQTIKWFVLGAQKMDNNTVDRVASRELRNLKTDVPSHLQTMLTNPALNNTIKK